MSVIYCMDTSAWIGMKQVYPAKTFLTLWQKLDTLAKSSHLISPHEVYKELERKDDEVLKWVKQRKQIFLKLNDEEIIALTLEIETKFPKLVDTLKETPEADPFVVALACLNKKNLQMFGDECIVVSEERPRSNAYAKPKIPDVCMYYNIRHFSNLDLIDNEGWKF